MPRRRKGIGAKAGKQPQKNVETNIAESRYESGGAKPKRKKGGVIRRPKAPMSYKRKKSAT